jgi:Leucine-rich repeat (LRR) protein
MATTRLQTTLPKALSTSVIKKKPTEEIKAIRMANNLICNLQILINPFCSMLDTSKVTWLDVSFNQIETLDPLIFEHFPNISTLNLQANKILKLSEIRKLEKFQRLKSIAIFGNPVEEHKHYRNYVLYYCKSLTNFDMSPVTKSERQMVRCFSPKYDTCSNLRNILISSNHINDSRFNYRMKFGAKHIGKRSRNCRRDDDDSH